MHSETKFIISEANNYNLHYYKIKSYIFFVMAALPFKATRTFCWHFILLIINKLFINQFKKSHLI